jgi:hypothetical protein
MASRVKSLDKITAELSKQLLVSVGVVCVHVCTYVSVCSDSIVIPQRFRSDFTAISRRFHGDCAVIPVIPLQLHINCN